MEIVILGLIGVAVFFALRHMKKHGPSCGGSCAGCTMDCKNRKQE